MAQVCFSVCGFLAMAQLGTKVNPTRGLVDAGVVSTMRRVPVAENPMGSCHRVSHWFQVESVELNGEVLASAEGANHCLTPQRMRGRGRHKHECNRELFLGLRELSPFGGSREPSESMVLCHQRRRNEKMTRGQRQGIA